LPSALFSARVLIENASLPEPGSVKQNAAIISPVARRGRYFAFCSGVPNNRSPLKPIDECAPTVKDVAESRPLISCSTRA